MEPPPVGNLNATPSEEMRVHDGRDEAEELMRVQGSVCAVARYAIPGSNRIRNTSPATIASASHAAT